MTGTPHTWLAALRATIAAPRLIGAVWLAGVLLMLPLTVGMHQALEDHLGASLEAVAAADGMNYDWWQEFLAQADGIETTFQPAIIGFAATLDNLSSVADAQPEQAAIAVLLLFGTAIWWFLLAGIGSLALSGQPLGLRAALAETARHWVPLVALAAAAAVLYWILFVHVHEWLLGAFFQRMTDGLPSERISAAWRAALYVVFLGLVLAVGLTLDYARLHVVRGSTRSPITAILRAVLFVGRRAGAVTRLVGLNGGALLAVIALWALVAPGAGSAGELWLHLALAQGYICGRIVLRIQSHVSHALLFRSQTATSPDGRP